MSRPAKFSTADEMLVAIEEYFVKCRGYILTAKNKKGIEKPVLSFGKPITVDKCAPTMAGLAVALGMSRQALNAYKGKKEFREVIDYARTLVEAEYEQALFEKNAQGAKFALMNNFDGWAEKVEQKSTTDLNMKLDPADKAAVTAMLEALDG